MLQEGGWCLVQVAFSREVPWQALLPERQQKEGVWGRLQLCVTADQKNSLLSHIQAVLIIKKTPLETLEAREKTVTSSDLDAFPDLTPQCLSFPSSFSSQNCGQISPWAQKRQAKVREDTTHSPVWKESVCGLAPSLDLPFQVSVCPWASSGVMSLPHFKRSAGHPEGLQPQMLYCQLVTKFPLPHGLTATCPSAPSPAWWPECLQVCCPGGGLPVHVVLPVENSENLCNTLGCRDLCFARDMTTSNMLTGGEDWTSCPGRALLALLGTVWRFASSCPSMQCSSTAQADNKGALRNYNTFYQTCWLGHKLCALWITQYLQRALYCFK